MEGLNATNSSGSGGEVLGGGDTSVKSANICNDTQKLSQLLSSVMREDRDASNGSSNDCDNMQDDSSSDDSSDSDEEDISEIVDLQKALEYLVSERDIEKIYNGIISTSQPTNTEQQQSDTEKNTNDDDEQLHMIPNLVNRILMECYSQQPPPTNQQHQNNDTSYAKKEISRKQRHKLTQLLLAVIVEFAEPYFVRVAQYKDQKRAKKIQQKKQKTEMKADDEMNKKQSAQPKEDISDSSLEFDERAISWATSCIKQLIEYPGPLLVSSSTSGIDSLFSDNNINETEIDEQTSLEDHHIPELDALLAATGKHDAMEMEQDFQRAILQGLQSRLLHMGIE